ncbi:MAG: zinc-ribbon domain-containing protein [Deltaproteobacteria bacterium]|nr:zinc-ribbon domain-containing protein [Deltaproteobacteria bacterium]
MKIVCAKCSARYSIADDKVAGRAFRVRCKRCSELIVCRPTPVAEDRARTGQRNESSVLFSLQNLRALATGLSTGGSSGSPATEVGSRAPTGGVSGEASGLIDIRALASAADANQESGLERASPESVDDLLRLGTRAPLGGGLGSPVFQPVVQRKRDRGLLIAVTAVGGIVVLAAAAIIAVLVTGPSSVVAATGPSTGTGPIAAGEHTRREPAPSATGAEGRAVPNTLAAPAAAPEGAHGEDRGEDPAPDIAEEQGAPGGDARPRDGRRNHSDRSSRHERRPERRPDRQPESAQVDARGTGAQTLDEFMNQAVGREAARAQPPSTLPATPSRDSVRAALRSVREAAARCGARNGRHGVANTTITVRGSTGRVASSRVTGQFAGTATGSCVARAVRGAHFPHFQQTTFQVSVPYRI